MRGHLEARGKNVWRAKVYLGRDADDKKRYLTRTIHGTKRQAEGALNELLVEAGRSEPVADGTFTDLIQRWLPLVRSRLSPSTLAEYERLLDKIITPRFGPTKVRALRPSDLDGFYAHLQRRGGGNGGPLSPKSVAHVHALIRLLLNQAVRWGWITRNPVTSASPPRIHKPSLHIPAPEVVGHLIAAATEHDFDFGCFLRLAAVTGARRGELCALRWHDLDRKAKTLRIAHSIVGINHDQLVEKGTKTHAVRRISLDPATLDQLSDYEDLCRKRAAACEVKLLSSSYIFSSSPDGTIPWRPNRATLAWVRLCENHQISGVRLHDLRHFAATQMLASGVDVKTVAGRLGHANAATTLNVYAHFLQSSDIAAAQLLAGILDGKRKQPGRSPAKSAVRR